VDRLETVVGHASRCASAVHETSGGDVNLKRKLRTHEVEYTGTETNPDVATFGGPQSEGHGGESPADTLLFELAFPDNAPYRPGRRLGEVLIQSQLATPAQIERGLEIQFESGGRLGEILVNLGIIDPSSLINALSEYFDIPLGDLRIEHPDPNSIALIPTDVAFESMAVPPQLDQGGLLVATDIGPEFDLMSPDQRADQIGNADVDITLLGRFAIKIDGELVEPITGGAQRLLAYLALHEDAVTRHSMAGTMWPEVSDHSADGSLRSALARLDVPTRNAILMASGGLSLEDNVDVDFRSSQSLAHRLVEHRPSPTEEDLNLSAVKALSVDLLPGWYDNWVVAEAEDWQILRRNALEVQADFLSADNRWGEAAGAARAAIRIDPLRESPQASLIRVHLARGNQSEALKVFGKYRNLLQAELGLEPTAHMGDLVADIQQ
jgi:DNA-binding SARP family transcriptional activator